MKFITFDEIQFNLLKLIIFTSSLYDLIIISIFS